MVAVLLFAGSTADAAMSSAPREACAAVRGTCALSRRRFSHPLHRPLLGAPHTIVTKEARDHQRELEMLLYLFYAIAITALGFAVYWKVTAPKKPSALAAIDNARKNKAGGQAIDKGSGLNLP